MRIWIDLVNSPHVLFFLPIIERLQKEGHQVDVTYRDFAQTRALVEHFAIQGTLIGGHGGKSKLGKIYNLFSRTVSLIKYAKGKGFDLALSHNSYFQIVAAKCCGIKTVTSMDFEGQPANHLAFRTSDLVILPEFFPEVAAKKFGARKIARYSGFKEDICLSDFVVDAEYGKAVCSAFGINEADLVKPVVVVRPPPTLALYHNDDESLFDKLLFKLNELDVIVLVLPRVDSQREIISKNFKQFHFSDVSVNGLQLVAFADAVISGGGSMNREAACLNTPAFSIFSGEFPAVDAQLAELGKLTRLDSEESINSLSFNKKEKNQKTQVNSDAINDFLNSSLRLIEGR